MHKIYYSLKNRKISITLNWIVAVFISLFAILYTNYYTQNLYTIAYTSIVIYLMFFITWFIQYKNKLNYYTIFLFFTYFFYFGQFFLLIIRIPFQTNRTILGGILTNDNLIKTGVFIMNFMILLHLTVLLTTIKIGKYDNENNFIQNKNIESDNIFYESFGKIGLMLFVISIIPSFIILIKNVYITFIYGYTAIFESEKYNLGGFDNILQFISRFTVPSFLILLISYRNNKKIIVIKVILIIYLVLYLLSGSRLNGVLLVSSLILIRHYWYKPISNKSIAKMCMFAIIGLLLLNLISAIRDSLYNTNDLSYLLKSTIDNIIKANPLFVAMEEAGYTFLAIATVITYCPSLINYNNGLSYINSLYMLIPNFFWDVHPAAKSNTDIMFKGFLTQYGGIGSSFISEAYYNMGYYSIFMAILFGVLIGIVTKNIVKYSRERNVMKFYLYIYIAQFSLFYVRSDTVSFWRNFIYYGVIPIIFSVLISKKHNITWRKF